MAADIRQLRSFVMVAEEGSFSRAADSLGISRSALSGHVDQLERHLGGRLLHRTARSVELTVLGSALLARARAAIEAVDLAVDEALPRPPGACLRIGLERHFDLELVLAVIASLAEPWPQIRWELTIPESVDAAHDLLNGTIDAAVVRNVVDHPDLDAQTLRDDPLVYVVHRNHGLALEANLSRSKIARAGAVLVEDGPEHRPRPGFGRGRGRDLRPRFVRWFMTVASGEAIGVAPLSLAARLPEAAFAIVPGDDLDADPVVVCHRRASTSTLANAFAVHGVRLFAGAVPDHGAAPSLTASPGARA